MTTTQDLASIERVEPRNIWPNEAENFTPWLADNLAELGKELGMELELDAKEAPVGKFSVDILAKEIGRDSVVVIENQIERTDHVHLGQLLTYAAGSEANIVIWVTTNFQDEHRAALDWLNKSTIESLEFYGVEIEVVRIGESAPAPLFRLAAFPIHGRSVRRPPINPFLRGGNGTGGFGRHCWRGSDGMSSPTELLVPITALVLASPTSDAP